MLRLARMTTLTMVSQPTERDLTREKAFAESVGPRPVRHVDSKISEQCTPDLVSFAREGIEQQLI